MHVAAVLVGGRKLNSSCANVFVSSQDYKPCLSSQILQPKASLLQTLIYPGGNRLLPTLRRSGYSTGDLAYRPIHQVEHHDGHPNEIGNIHS